MPKNNWYAMQAMGNGRVQIDIYDEIGFWGVTAKEFKNELESHGSPNEIELHINSPGGSVTDGIAIYNLLKNHAARIEVHVDAIAASMASIIAMAGDEIVMPANSLMMIHNPWGMGIGDADELRKTAGVLDKMAEAMTSAYADKSGLARDEIQSIMQEETWYTGSEAVEAGFADRVTDDVQLAASFDLNKLPNHSPLSGDNPLAVANVKPKQEENTMSQKDKANGAPAAPNKTAAADPASEPTTQQPDVNAAAQKAIDEFKAKEKARKEAIGKAFGNFAEQHGDLLNECLTDMDCTPEQAQAKLLDKLGEGSEPQQGGFGAHIHAGNGDNLKQAMTAGLKARAGIKLEDEELKEGQPFRAMTLAELARASLVEKGVGVASYGDRMQLVGAAFTHSTSDFGHILLDVANKSMLKGYEEAEETFQQWTQPGILSDFKVNQRVGLNTFPSLKQVPEGAEYSHATMGDRGEPIQLATYGRLFSITRQAIINDDLSALTRIPMAMGRAAIRTIGNLVYAILTDNPNMADGTALFHADHSNYKAGANTALSVDALTAGRTAMRTQKDPTGNTLNIRPSYLLVPAALEVSASKLMRDTVQPGKNNSESNPVAGMAEVITEPRLDDASAKAWYLAAGQAYDTIEVAYLDGIQTPFMEQMEGFTVDGVQSKVRIDAGVKALDHRTLYKAKGEA